MLQPSNSVVIYKYLILKVVVDNKYHILSRHYVNSLTKLTSLKHHNHPYITTGFLSRVLQLRKLTLKKDKELV